METKLETFTNKQETVDEYYARTYWFSINNKVFEFNNEKDREDPSTKANKVITIDQARMKIESLKEYHKSQS